MNKLQVDTPRYGPRDNLQEQVVVVLHKTNKKPDIVLSNIWHHDCCSSTAQSISPIVAVTEDIGAIGNEKLWKEIYSKKWNLVNNIGCTLFAYRKAKNLLRKQNEIAKSVIES